MIFDELKPAKTVQGNNIPIFKSDAKGKAYTYLVAGISGEHVEGVYVLQKLFNWLMKNHDLEDMPLLIIPILNVDGYQVMMPNNSNDVKIIENFPTSLNKNVELEPESEFLFKQFKKYRPKNFIVFSKKRPPCIHFNEKGKPIANYISKLNSYDLKNLSTDSKVNNLEKHIREEYDSTYINICPPKISDDISLDDIWHQNSKALKELFVGGLLAK